MGRAIAVAAVVTIAVLTLIPQPAEPKPFGKWCLVCGDLGGTDVVANVLLFLPLGVGLALAGARRWRSVAAALALSLLVESLQLAGIPGRTGTLSDVLTNGSGALLGHLLGATWPRWLTPRRSAARALAAGALGGWIAAQTLGAWLYAVPRVEGPEPPPTVAPGGGGARYGWYAGHVTAASLDGVPLAHAGTGPVRVEGGMGRASTIAATIDASDARPGLVPFVIVLDAAGRERLMLAQVRGDLVLTAGERALALAVRRPVARVVGALRVAGTPAIGAAPLPAPLRVAGGVRGDTLWVRVGDGRPATVRLAPSLLWSSIVPWVRPSTLAGDVAQWLWLAGLLAPLGYLLAWGARPAVALVVMAGAAALGTWGIAAGFGYGAPPLAEPATALLGAVVGWLAARLARSRDGGRVRATARTPARDAPTA